MIRIPVHELRPNEALARSIVNPTDPRKVLLPRGKRLDKRIINILPKLGLRSVWIEGDGKGLFENLLTEADLTMYREIVAELNLVCGSVREGEISANLFVKFRDQVITLWDYLRQRDAPYLAFEDLHETGGHIGFHSVNVCHLAFLLAYHLTDFIRKKEARNSAFSDAEIAALGLGALLHDIGKMGVSLEIMQKDPWELSQREVQELQEHVEKGFRLVQRQVGGAAANLIFSHHLYADGTGYPLAADISGVSDEQGVFARIVCAANAYDGLITHTDYLPIEALEELNCARPHQFPGVVRVALNHLVPPFALGQTVTLSSGHRAVVTAFNAEAPFRPAVLMLAEANGHLLPESQRIELQLSEYPKVRIVRANGRPVEHLVPKDNAKSWEEIA